MEEWIIQLMQSMGEWGIVGIFLLMTAENLFPPIPSEVVLTFAGFLTTHEPLAGNPLCDLGFAGRCADSVWLGEGVAGGKIAAAGI